MQASYERLGRRTLVAFFLRRSWVVLLALILIGVLTLILSIVPEEWSSKVSVVFWIGIALGIIAIGTIANAAWLEYSHYGIFLGDSDFRFRHGIVGEEDEGVPYRRIRQVNVGRNPLEMALGLSTLIIILADGGEDAQRSAVRIRSLDKKLAAELQEELLKRAESQIP